MPTGVYVRTAEHNRKNSESTKGLKRSEEAKANMKGHSGVYIRTALNLKNLKVAQNRPEMKKIKSINTKKQWQDSVCRKKMTKSISEANKIAMNRPEVVAKIRANTIKQFKDPKAREKASNNTKAQWADLNSVFNSIENRRKRSKSAKKLWQGKRAIMLAGHKTLEAIENHRRASKITMNLPDSIDMKKLWANPEYQKMMCKALHKKPNNLEKFFNKQTPEHVKYVGDFSLWIKTKDGTRNPDFIIKGQDKVIEIFGDYYHKGENPQDKIKEYAKVGWNCKVFWEHEIYDNTEKVLNEVLNFIKKPPELEKK